MTTIVPGAPVNATNWEVMQRWHGSEELREVPRSLLIPAHCVLLIFIIFTLGCSAHTVCLAKASGFTDVRYSHLSTADNEEP